MFIIDPDAEARADVVRIADEMCIASEQFASAEQFLDAYTPRMPGCIVTEFRLLGMNGIELQQSLALDCIALPVIFVSAYAETTFTVKAMQKGAVTVLEKPFSEQELWDAIRKGLAQDQTIRRIDARHSETRRRLSRLTEKERDVLNLLVEGKANKSIARSLNISIRTVEARRHQIFKKTDTDSIAQLVRLILQSPTKEQM